MIIIKFIALMAAIAALLSYRNPTLPEPQILDGPGMEYVDSAYRNDYANCLPFADIRGEPYLAIAYLGKKDVGKENTDLCIDKLFHSLDAEKRNCIKTYEYEGDDWFLVVPKYHDEVIIQKGEEKVHTAYGEPFAIRCNSEVTLNIFDVTDMYFRLETDENGQLKGAEHNILNTEDCTTWGPENFVWDITHFIAEK